MSENLNPDVATKILRYNLARQQATIIRGLADRLEVEADQEWNELHLLAGQNGVHLNRERYTDLASVDNTPRNYGIDPEIAAMMEGL
jgi:hypothetical protein